MSKRKPAPKDPKRAEKGQKSRRSRTPQANPAIAKAPHKRHAAVPRSEFGGSVPSKAPGGAYWLYGLHAVTAALSNRRRRCYRLVTAADLAPLQEALGGPMETRQDLPSPESMPRGEIDALLPDGAVHQGLALLTSPLPPCALEDLLDGPGRTTDQGYRLLVALDQVTDPHNVGAILRSAAAFGASGLILPDRHTAPESGILAKVASGALDVLPIARVGNLSRVLAALKTQGFWCVGLAEEADTDLTGFRSDRDLVLVLGAEGKGLRRLTREHCDLLLRLPTRPPIGSLNVSNAAAVALYALINSS